MMLIICNGMPRSGSTALYNFISRYLREIIQVKELGFLSYDDLSEMENFLLEISSAKEVYLIKTHYILPEKLKRAVAAGIALEVYTIRDIGDVAISMNRIWEKTESEIYLELDQHCIISYEKAKEKRVILFRYGDIDKRAGYNILVKISEFIERPFSDLALKKSIKEYKKMQLTEKSKFAQRFKWAWYKFAIRVNSRLRLGRFLKVLISSYRVGKIKERILLIDSRTKLHPNHISSVEPTETQLTLAIRTKNRYSAWQRDFRFQ